MACAALRQRLLTIWWIWVSSAATKIGSSGRCERELDPRAQGGAAEVDRGGDGGAEVDRDARRPLAAAEGQDLGAPAGARAAGAHDAVERCSGRSVGGSCSSATSVEVKMVARMLLKS